MPNDSAPATVVILARLDAATTEEGFGMLAEAVRRTGAAVTWVADGATLVLATGVSALLSAWPNWARTPAAALLPAALPSSPDGIPLPLSRPGRPMDKRCAWGVRKPKTDVNCPAPPLSPLP